MGSQSWTWLSDWTTTTIILLLCISLFCSVNVYFIYFRALMLGAYIFVIVIFLARWLFYHYITSFLIFIKVKSFLPHQVLNNNCFRTLSVTDFYPKTLLSVASWYPCYHWVWRRWGNDKLHDIPPGKMPSRKNVVLHFGQGKRQELSHLQRDRS